MQLGDKTTLIKDQLRIFKKINTIGSLSVIWGSLNVILFETQTGI